MPQEVILNNNFSVDVNIKLGNGRYGDTYTGKIINDITEIIAKQVSGRPIKKDANSLKEYFTRDDVKSNQYLLPYLDYTLNKDAASWIIMEYCEQGNLADYYEKNPKLTTSDEIDLMTQCADGIAHLHSCQIIHREIKPENILLRKQGDQDIIQIADYFSATIFKSEYLPSQQRSKSQPNSWDEYYFKPPEAFRKTPAKITECYDIFSLGLVYYAMVNGCTNLKPVVKGNNLPIGWLISEKHSEGWKFDIEVVDKISGLKQVIDNMIVLKFLERLSSSDVLEQLKVLQQVTHERSAEQHKKKDISSCLHMKFHQSLLESGPCTPTCDKIQDQVSELQKDELKTVLAKGSTKDFLLEFDDIIWKDDKLQAVENCLHMKFHQLLLESGPCTPTCDKILDQVSELQKDELKIVLAKGSIKDFLLEFDDIIWKDDKLQAVENNKERDTIFDSCDKNEEEHNKFKIKIASDDEIKPFILDTYTSLDGNIIYVSTEKENIEKVTDHLKTYHKEFTCKCFFPNNFKWLMTNEETTISVDNCIGPGSFMSEDKPLGFLKKHRGNKTLNPLRNSMSDLHSWGSIGCFARNRFKPTEIYALSAKHIVDKNIGYDHDHNLDMVSGFQQEHKVTAKHHANITMEELNVIAKDFVHITKGYHGLLGGMNESNVIVDVALFGPLSNAMKRNHEGYPIEPRKKITVFPSNGSDIVRKRVMKYGAKTGYTSGIIIETNKKCYMPLQGKKEFTGAFVVTTTNREGGLDQEGTFASPGDSGSIVLLKDDLGSLKGIGIIHSQLDVFPYRGMVLKNVVFCVGLDNCIKSLEQQLMIHLDLYYHNFTPKLCVEGPEVTKRENSDTHMPGNMDTPATSLAQDTDDCVLCYVKKEVVEKMPKRKYKEN